MKANTGNGKLPSIKERKSGHCELQRTAWKSTVDIQFGQTRGTNKKKEKNENAEQTRARTVSDIAENHRLRNRYRQSQTSYAGFFRMSDERNWDGNRLRPEIISSLLSLTSRRPFFVKEQRDTVIEFIWAAKFVHVKPARLRDCNAVYVVLWGKYLRLCFRIINAE